VFSSSLAPFLMLLTSAIDVSDGDDAPLAFVG